MKKRNLFLALVMSLVMMLTACGDSNPFVGTWRGTCDLTDAIVEAATAGDPTMEEYLVLEGLTFEVIFEFTEDGEMEMHVDEDSMDVFVENMEDGMYKMMDAYLQDELSGYGYSNDEIAELMGYDSYDAMMDDMIDQMNLESTIVDPFIEQLDLSGEYEYDEEDGILTLEYDDDQGEEEFEYEFDGDKLIITIEDEDVEFVIECEKE